MNCFDIIKNVLDELWESLDGTEQEKADQIKKAQKSLSKNYKDIANSEVIDYDDPATQFAYIFTYTAAHGDFLYQLLRRTSRHHKFNIDRCFHILSLGGGPGSDLIGCLKFLDTLDKKNLKIQSNSFDRNDGWSFCWSNVASCIHQDDDDECIYQQLTPLFHTLDVTKASAIKKINKFLDSNLITMVFFMSEVLKSKDEAEDFFNYLFENASKDTVIVLVDNKMDDVIDWFDGLVETHNYKVLISDGDRAIASSSEQSSSLKRYTDLIGLNPKVQGNIITRAVRKNDELGA